MLRRIGNLFLWIWIFLIPWQVRYIFSDPLVGGEPWEYGRMSLYIGDIIFILLLGLAIIVWLRERGASRVYFWPALCLIIFTAWCWIGVLWSVEPGVSAYFAARITQWLALLAVIAVLKPSFNLIISSIIAIGVTQTLLGIFQFGTGEVIASKWLGMAAQSAAELGSSVVETSAGRWLRAYGSLPHPNMYGGFIAIALLAVVYLASRMKRWSSPWLLVLLLFLGEGLVMSFSRSSWIGLIFGALFLVALAWREKPALRKIIIAVCLLVSVFALNFLLEPALFITRFSASGRLEAQSFAERGDQINMALNAIGQHPLGLGIGGYTAWLMEILPAAPAYVYQPVHNIYALIWAEIGLVGIALFIALIVFILQAHRKIRYRQAGAYYLSGLFALLAIGIFDHYLLTLFSGIMIFGLFISLLLVKVEPGS